MPKEFLARPSQNGLRICMNRTKIARHAKEETAQETTNPPAKSAELLCVLAKGASIVHRAKITTAAPDATSQPEATRPPGARSPRSTPPIPRATPKRKYTKYWRRRLV